ncbi:Protein of unknown function [Rhizobiales bacterium GAS113]|nr:Protein of unknown function [Rhizobiales bacterium GAS113]
MIRELDSALPAAPLPRPFPAWARLRQPPERATDAAFLAGAGLGCLHAMARSEDPPATLWRQRLALTAAAASARMAGRREDEAALRDAWYCAARAILARPGASSTPGSVSPSAPPRSLATGC